MATLLTLSDVSGSASDVRDRDPADGLRGKLDPLTLATYRWRLMTGLYDSDAVVDVLVNRLTAEVMGL